MSLDATRRSFFQGMFGSAAAVAMAQQALAQQDSANGLPTRRLGRTDEQVSIMCLGGWHIGAVEDKNEAIRIMDAAIDEGMTFFDNAWEYHDGGSEEIMGRALSGPGKREKVFLMTKSSGRDEKFAQQCLDDSLRRLQTDYIDLWQFHEMNYDNDPDWVLDRGGLKTALAAQKAGKVRYIGFTGHKAPSIHIKMLNKPYDWATAQMPINVMDAHYRSFQKEAVPACLARDVGVIGMKSFGGGDIPAKSAATHEECRRYALSLPVSTLVVGIRSMDELMADIKIGRGFKPMADDQKAVLLSKVADVAGDGRYERFKSTQDFDGPSPRKQHGFAVG